MVILVCRVALSYPDSLVLLAISLVYELLRGGKAASAPNAKAFEGGAGAGVTSSR